MVDNSFRKSCQLCWILLLFSAVALSWRVDAGNVPQDDPSQVDTGQPGQSDQPCGSLARMDGGAAIYNNSQYGWMLHFKTAPHFIGFFKKVPPGAVRYRAEDGSWQIPANATGAQGAPVTVPVPVQPHQKVDIAYCGQPYTTKKWVFAESVSHRVIEGTVDIEPFDTGSGVSGTRPPAGLRFFGRDMAPVFDFMGKTPHVATDRQPGGKVERGSIIICPNDVACIRR